MRTWSITPTDPQLTLSYGGVPVAGTGNATVRYLSEDALQRVQGIAAADRVVAAVPVALESVAVGDKHVLAMGTDLDQARAVKLWWKVEGRFPAAADEVLVGLNVRNELGVEPGSVLDIGGRPVRVSGVLLETGSEDDNLIIMASRLLRRLPVLRCSST